MMILQITCHPNFSSIMLLVFSLFVCVHLICIFETNISDLLHCIFVIVFKVKFLKINSFFLCVCLVIQSCLTLCDPMDCSLPGSTVYGDSPGKNTGVGCRALLHGIFPNQGLNPGLPHCRQILHHLSHQGNQCWFIF